MKLLQPLVLALLLILLISCRSAQQKPTAVFDPMTLGPAGPTLKKYLDRSGQPPRSTPTVARVQIEAELPNMSKKGVMVVDKTVDAKGHISYEMKSFTGDNIVKTKVIGLYLSAEQEASQHQVPAITPANYRFKFKRKDSLGDRIAMVFDLTPIRKMIGLFKGELWLEEQSGLEIKQTGRLVKNPSVIFKSADLTREFQIKGEETFLSNVDYQAETRVVGKVLMKMQFDEPRPAEETPSRP
ncbi:MAG: hypothetical protein FJW36_15980 [Acidobacteria bacterium]|nr:hypothetical protein [Acidobacteriota bacterium]